MPESSVDVRGDRRARPAPESPASAGRSMPFSEEAEQHVLACCLLDGNDTIARCLEAHVGAETFYLPANRVMFEVILDLYQKGQPVMLEVVAEELNIRRLLETVGGLPYLMQVTARIPTTAHAGYFIEKVRLSHQLRELIRVATSTVEQCHNFAGEGQEFFDKIEQDLFKVTQDRVSDSAEEIKEAIKEANTVIAKLLMKKGELTGVTSGFKDLDAMTFGFQRQEMIVVAARPSMGKTSFALNIAEHAAVHDKKSVGVFSLEMSKEQLVLRLLSSVANIDSQRLRSGFLEELDFARIAPAMNALSEAPIYIDDTPNITTMELRTKARRLQAESGLDLVIVDYLQLMQSSTTTRDANRVQEVSEISRGLKALARELKVPVVALSQLSRQPEMRESREPRLSDLRESGSIEQDADLVMFLWREKDRGAEDQSAEGEVIKLKLSKHRNGPTGEIDLWFKKAQTRFVNYAGERFADVS
jgi:replicative DNA helicase